MTVSIIIPIYNVERFVGRCLKSVLKQTYREIEVILVNDCTPDRSMDVVKDIIDHSENIHGLAFRFINHTENLGLSAARNSGIDAATGDYLFFLDSDDEILPNCIASFVMVAQRYPGVDYICGGVIFNYLSEDNQIFLPNYLPEYTQDADVIHYDMECVINGALVTAWNKLIRRSLIQNNHLYFKEGIINEDFHWRLIYRNYIKSMATNLNPTYIYHFDNSSSICRKDDYNLQKITSHLEIMKDYIPTIDDNRRYVPFIHFIYVLLRQVVTTLDENTQKRVMKDFSKTILFLINSAKVPLRVKCILEYLLFPFFLVRSRGILFIGRCMGLWNLPSQSFLIY